MELDSGHLVMKVDEFDGNSVPMASLRRWPEVRPEDFRSERAESCPQYKGPCPRLQRSRVATTIQAEPPCSSHCSIVGHSGPAGLTLLRGSSSSSRTGP
eukprot:2093706-Alexandrium_andersonii.AAC.1